MVKKTPEELNSLAGSQFANMRPVLSLWQTLARHFYPEMANFTSTHNIGEELGTGVYDSYPILARRDLGNSLSATLRDGDWFDMVAREAQPGVGDSFEYGNQLSYGEVINVDHDGAQWMQHKTQVLLSQMRAQNSGFIRATKEADHNYVTFGQCAMSVEPNRARNGLLYRSWHLRDMAWREDESGNVCDPMRRWEPTAIDAVTYFGEDNLHKNVVDAYNGKGGSSSPYNQCKFVHMVLRSAIYGDEELMSRFPYVSIWLDTENNHLIEAVGLKTKYYIIPRFQTIAGSPFAYSPATVVSLPDARTLQAMTSTLLEAAERYAAPPIIATANVVRGDVDLSPNGITLVDDEYDEKMGAALRPLPQDRGGFPIAAGQRENVVEIISSAFYLNKLSLPDVGRDMTAYEVQERMKQFRRENMPLFAPIEAEYSGELCEVSFELSRNMGFFGSDHDIPDSLLGKDVSFKFQSPITQTDSEMKAAMFRTNASLIREAAEFDPGVKNNMDFDLAIRDAIRGIGTPEDWLRSMEEVGAIRTSEAEAAALAKIQEAVGALGAEGLSA